MFHNINRRPLNLGEGFNVLQLLSDLLETRFYLTWHTYRSEIHLYLFLLVYDRLGYFYVLMTVVLNWF